MRLAGVFLALAFASLQSFALVDCCCGTLCERPNETCGDHAPEPASDCCGGGPSAPSPCTHIEPSHDVATPAHGLPVEARVSAAALELELPTPGPAAPAATVPAPERGSPPLYLVHSALLI